MAAIYHRFISIAQELSSLGAESGFRRGGLSDNSESVAQHRIELLLLASSRSSAAQGTNASTDGRTDGRTENKSSSLLISES